MSTVLLDAAGRRRSPATVPDFHSGRPPRNKGRRYPADPPKVEEIVAVMRQAGTTPHGLRMRGLIVVLWRAGLRIHEALALTEADLDARRGLVLVRRARAAAAAKSAWTTGPGNSFSVVELARRAVRRPAVLHPLFHRSPKRPIRRRVPALFRLPDRKSSFRLPRRPP
jgi:integrase